MPVISIISIILAVIGVVGISSFIVAGSVVTSIILAAIGAGTGTIFIIRGIVQMTIAILSCSHYGDVEKNKAKFKAYFKNAYISVARGIVIVLIFAVIVVLINLKYLLH